MSENHLPIKLKRVSWHVVDENDDTIFEGFPGEESNLDEMINRWHLHPVLVEASKGAEKLPAMAVEMERWMSRSQRLFIADKPVKASDCISRSEELAAQIKDKISAIHSALAQVRGK